MDTTTSSSRTTSGGKKRAAVGSKRLAADDSGSPAAKRQATEDAARFTVEETQVTQARLVHCMLGMHRREIERLGIRFPSQPTSGAIQFVIPEGGSAAAPLDEDADGDYELLFQVRVSTEMAQHGSFNIPCEGVLMLRSLTQEPFSVVRHLSVLDRYMTKKSQFTNAAEIISVLADIMELAK